MDSISALDAVAIKLARQPKGWMPYLYEALDQGGIQVTGCMTGVFTRGPRKGQTKYLVNERRVTVFVPPKRRKLVQNGRTK